MFKTWAFNPAWGTKDEVVKGGSCKLQLCKIQQILIYTYANLKFQCSIRVKFWGFRPTRTVEVYWPVLHHQMSHPIPGSSHARSFLPARWGQKTKQVFFKGMKEMSSFLAWSTAAAIPVISKHSK